MPPLHRPAALLLALLLSPADGSPLAAAPAAAPPAAPAAVAPAFDCNGNGVEDAVDIAAGTSPDANANGVPDECEAGLGRGAGVPLVDPGPAPPGYR